MMPKKTLNLAIPQDLLEEFNAACANYGHGKQKGMVLSAAILMFLKAEPSKQGEYIHQIMAADIAQGVKNMLAEKVELAKKQAAEKADTKASLQSGPKDTSEKPAMPRKAAKKAGKAVKGISRLPRLDDFNKTP